MKVQNKLHSVIVLKRPKKTSELDKLEAQFREMKQMKMSLGVKWPMFQLTLFLIKVRLI